MQTDTQIKFSQESASACFEEALPLLHAHWEEITHYKDIPLDPDYETYRKIEAAGLMRAYTARNSENKLVGYAVYFLKHNPHYKTSLNAVQDIIYIDPAFRGGTGAKFIKWCDAQLKAEKVQIVFHHVKLKHNFGLLLERFGYEPIDIIYGKRLDLEGE